MLAQAVYPMRMSDDIIAEAARTIREVQLEFIQSQSAGELREFYHEPSSRVAQQAQINRQARGRPCEMPDAPAAHIPMSKPITLI
jgi:hypothetical protein